MIPEVAWALQERDHKGVDSDTKEGHLIPVAFKASHFTRGKDGAPSDVAAPLAVEDDRGDQSPLVVAMNLRGRDGGVAAELDDKASLRAADGGSSRSYVAFHGTQDPDVSGDIAAPLARNSGQENAIAGGWAIRRLTPTEAARLQGFSDHHARVDAQGRPVDQCPDGPQYKAYGNAMAVPCVRWILERIEAARKES